MISHHSSSFIVSNTILDELISSKNTDSSGGLSYFFFWYRGLREVTLPGGHSNTWTSHLVPRQNKGWVLAPLYGPTTVILVHCCYNTRIEQSNALYPLPNASRRWFIYLIFRSDMNHWSSWGVLWRWRLKLWRMMKYDSFFQVQSPSNASRWPFHSLVGRDQSKRPRERIIISIATDHPLASFPHKRLLNSSSSLLFFSAHVQYSKTRLLDERYTQRAFLYRFSMKLRAL